MGLILSDCLTWKAGTRSALVISGPTAFWRSVNLSATMYLQVEKVILIKIFHLYRMLAKVLPNSPGLVLGALPQCGHHQLFHILRLQQWGDRHACLHRQQPNRILKSKKIGYDVVQCGPAGQGCWKIPIPNYQDHLFDLDLLYHLAEVVSLNIVLQGIPSAWPVARLPLGWFCYKSKGSVARCGYV